jgi:DNA-binding transcriptional LysR family regulator
VTERSALHRQLENEIICTCGCRHPVGSCGMLNCPGHASQTAKLQQFLAEGKDHDAVLAAFVQDFGGQDVLTVPDMRSKIRFQCAGLGVGYLPLHMTRADVQASRLLIRQVVETRIGTPLFIAWHTAQRGKALAWFLERLEDPALRESLLA